MAWLPFSIAEAALSGHGGGEVDLPTAWAHLLERLKAAGELVASSQVNRNRVDYASGMRHLMVLSAVGIDEALRVDPDPVLAVTRTSTDDILTWGMECPDCIYLRATLRGGETYRLFGNRGTARYVGLQTMNGIASTANCLVDDLEVDADGNFEAMLSADERDGNWLRMDGDHPTLVVRHFFYDWDTEKPSTLQIERIGDERRTEGPLGGGRRRGVASDLRARGVRPRQPQVLPRLQRRSAGQRVHAADRPLRHGRRRGEPSSHRSLRTRTRRGIDPRGRAARRACTGVTRSAISGGRPSTTVAISPASMPIRRRSTPTESFAWSSARGIPESRIGLIRPDIAMAR